MPVSFSRQRWLMPAAVACLVGIAGCQAVQTTQPGAVGVTRTQRMAVSAEEIEAASMQAYRQMLREAEAKGVLDRNAQQLARVRGVTDRLVAQADTFRSDARKWDWEAHLFESPQINAFAMAGGKIGVYSGLIEGLRLTDDELAAVIGHEIAHALREHVREQVSLQAELEADRIGVELAARAGYDPRAAVSLWRKMREAGGNGPPAFLSTHPTPGDRQERLMQAAQQVMPLYRQAIARR